MPRRCVHAFPCVVGVGMSEGKDRIRKGRRSASRRTRAANRNSIGGNRLPRATVYIVDDDAGVRDSLAWLVSSMQLTARTFATGDEFLSAYDATRPGCLVVDVRLPGMSGLQLQQEVAARGA